MLDVAEQLFSQHGFDPVKIRHIADMLGKSQALVYHHFPGGKEELYVAVQSRMLMRFREGIRGAQDAAGASLLSQLRHVAAFMLAQPPMDLDRMVNTDMQALQPEHAAHLKRLAAQCLFGPMVSLFTEWHAKGAILNDPLVVAGMFFAIITSARSVPEAYLAHRTRQALADEMIDVMYRGIKA